MDIRGDSDELLLFALQALFREYTSARAAQVMARVAATAGFCFWRESDLTAAGCGGSESSKHGS